MKKQEETNNYRGMSVADLHKQIKSLRLEIINPKEEKDAHAVSKKRKSIARIKTVIAEKNILSNE